MLRAGETTALRNGEIAMEIIVLLVLERDDRSVVYTSSFMAD